MKKKSYIRIFHFVLGLVISQSLFSQRQADNWLVGDFGLQFIKDSVAIRHDYAQHESRGAGIISDKNGNLLFYTDGFNVWNKNHTLMPNGSNVLSVSGGPKLHESVVIPQPGSESIFYIFTVNAYNGQSASGLYYSIVDLSLNNGLGDVTVKAKKILNKTTNKITAVYHSNRSDVWIVTHEYNTNNYYAWLVNKSGVTETPVINTLGKSVKSSFDGQLKASPDGKKMACCYDASSNLGYGFDLFDFNNTTGELSNAMTFYLPISYRGCDGLEFSPDATKLFVYQFGSTGESGLYQFDITGKTYDNINNSRVRVFQDRDNALLQMQLAPNGKIYFTKGGGQDSGTRYLGIVENPNESGNECIVKELGLYLDGGSAFVARTPNFIQNYFFKTNFTVSNPCAGSPVNFIITNESRLDSVRWAFGEGSSSTTFNPQFKYPDAGKYSVRLQAYYPEKCDTIIKEITINPSPELDLGKDTTVCNGYELSIAEGFTSYKWSTGDSTRSVIIRKTGSYKVTVGNSYGCFSTDSVFLKMADLPEINLPDSIQLGALDSIQLNPGKFKSYSWSTGETTSSIYVKKEGWYSVTVENETGCNSTKSFYVYKQPVNTDDPSGWKLLNPKPSVLTGQNIYFINSQTGFIVNDKQLLGTTDGGTTWKIIMNLVSGNKIAFKNNFGYIIGNSGTIYKSTYKGGGWNKLNVSFTDNLISINLISQDTVVITSSSKLFASYNGGVTWQTLNLPVSTVESAYFTTSAIGYIGCSNGSIYKTVNGGLNWSVKSSVSYFPANITRIYFMDKNTGFASRGYSDILKTTDGGENWKTTTGTSDAIYSYFFLDPKNGFIAGEYGVIFKTTNGGSSWDWIGFQKGRIDGTSIYSLYFIDSMTGFATGMGGRILKTVDGGKTWQQYSPNYGTIRQLKFITDQIAYGLVGNSFLKTTDGGNSWTNMGAPLSTGNTNQFDFIDENTGYCIAGGDINSSASVGKVYKTIDGAKTWIPTNNGMELMNDNLYAIDFLDKDTGYVSGGYNDDSTYKTINGGNTWTKLNSISFGQIQFLNPQVGYARNVGNLYNRIYKTIDGGKNWTPTFEIDDDIKAFHFLDINNGYFVGDNALMYKTTDGGTSWQKLTIPYAYFIKVKFYTPNVGYILDDYGKMYQTTNGGISWTQVNIPYMTSAIECFGKDIFAFGSNGLILKKRVDFSPVTLTANAATAITNKSVSLSGSVASNEGKIGDIKFEYGKIVFNNSIAVTPDNVQSNTASNFSVALNDLSPNTTYNYRVSAIYNGIKYTSNTLQFKTLPDYQMCMNYVSSYTSNEADLSGTVSANSGNLSDIVFQYGTDTTFVSKAEALPGTVSEGTTKNISAHITSLKPQTLYYIRIKAMRNGSPVYSNKVSFNTRPDYTIYMYSPNIIGNSAGLQAYITAYKDTIRNVAVEYGTTREYKNQIATTPNQINKGYSSYISAQLNGMDSTAVYFYRIKGEMGTETIYSNENILTLKKGVIMIPIEIKLQSDSSVLMQGLINSKGAYIYNIKFQYGLSGNYSDSIAASPSAVYSSLTSKVTSKISKVIPNVKYYARLTATDGTKKYYSEEFTFTVTSNDSNLINKDVEISVYPNPVEDYFIIESTSPVDKVDIIDSFGKMQSIQKDGNRLDISNYPKGIYIVKIFTDNKLKTRKIIKK